MRVLTTLLLIPLLASGGSASPGPLDWLAGCWTTPDKSSQEVWVMENQQSLIGFAVAIHAGELAFYEVLSIRQSRDGSWVYTAHPSGQASAAFTATETSENSVVFTNPDHDYPQVIRYQRDGKQLHATISLLGGDKPNSFDKLACD